MNAVEVKDLSFKYRNQPEYSLQDISFSIPRGSCTVLLGPNGAGKSTLLSLISGLFDSRDLKLKQGGVFFPAFSDQSRFLSYCTQQCALYGELSIKENLEFFSKILNPAKSPEAEINSLAKALDFEKFLSKRIDQCSGGIQQRAHVAVALLHQYPLIVLDEPFNNIDPESRALISTTIKNYMREKGVTFLVSSHQFEAIEDLWTHMVFIKNGKLAEFLSRGVVDNHKKLQHIFEELK